MEEKKGFEKLEVVWGVGKETPGKGISMLRDVRCHLQDK